MSRPSEVRTILEGVVGSTAYGLATPDSDIDVLGVYAVPLRHALRVDWHATNATIHRNDPDTTHHEVQKFLRLVCAGNPTVTELLWLDDYTVTTPAGRSLVEHRRAFLSTRHVRSAYLGYANQQAKRLERRHADGREGFASDLRKRTRKHGRHCWRLLLQAEHALRTGDVLVHVGDRRDDVFAIGELAERDPIAFARTVEHKMEQVKATPSVLGDEPDIELADTLLYRIRLNELG
ncbi:MAG: nucleotidyltransferase domain-containing protein [Actinomycetota bacterium]